MYLQKEKSKENKSHLAGSTVSQKKSGSKSTFKFVDNRPEVIAQQKVQLMANNHAAQQYQSIPKKENNTGLPDNLKSGIENLSGYSMDDVKVHYNSDKPAQLQAHAYAQGTDIHLASGQEKHLPHESWHVVQQKQGRVKPTMQMKGRVNGNDDVGLEKEADFMGEKAASIQMSSAATQYIDQQDLNNKKSDTGTVLKQCKAKVYENKNAPIQLNKKGAAAGAVIGGGLGAFGFFAGPIVGAITTSVCAVIGAIVGHIKSGNKLPAGAYARKDKTLTLVKQSELNAILEGAVEDNAITEELSNFLLATGTALIGKKLLFWTEGAEPHCEVLIDDRKEDTYRVNVVTVLPKRSAPAYRYYEGETGEKLARGAAIHELVHALEVVSKIGGTDNLGEEVPKVTEGDSELEGRQLQWSSLPDNTTEKYIDELMLLMEEQKDLVQSQEDAEEFLWDYYKERLKYGKENRHEIPTVIVQIIHDIISWGDLDKLEGTAFHNRLLEVRADIVNAL